MGGFSEDDLAELLAFVRGEGKWAHLGKGITSYPQATNDQNKQNIHAGMLLLEARGNVRRHYVDQYGSVTWAPSDEIDSRVITELHNADEG